MTDTGPTLALCLVGLLFTGVLRVRGASRHPSKSRVDCSLDSLESCLRMLQELAQSDRMAFAATREDLDKVCRQLREGVSCVDKHMDHCFNKQQRKVVESVVAGSRQSIVDLCLDKQMQAEYLEHAPCYREVATNAAKCFPHYQQVVLASKNTANESNEPVDVQAGLKRYCCAFTEFLSCKFRFVDQECSAEASRFLQTHTERMSGALIHQHCALYTYDSTCSEPQYSASSAAIAALLPLVCSVLCAAYAA